MRGVVKWAVALAAFLAPAAGAEPYAVGSALPSLALPDQHGQIRELDEQLRLVIFSRDMGGGGVIKRALAEDGAAFLERNRARYVADVSGMPGIVRRLMALPAIRRRPYPVLLDEEGSLTADFPSEKDKATLLFVEQLRIVRVQHVGSAQALREVVEPAAPAGDSGSGD